MYTSGAIEGVTVKPLKKFVDERGWLSELFRRDELEAPFSPAMSYISSTRPGVVRGPHEHREQTDCFCFIGPSNFKLTLWDNRPASPTYRYRMVILAGEDSPMSALIPPGVVHAYQNVGEESGIVLNFPDRLFRGPGKKEEVDEIRHEDDPDTPFRVHE